MAAMVFGNGPSLPEHIPHCRLDFGRDDRGACAEIWESECSLTRSSEDGLTTACDRDTLMGILEISDTDKFLTEETQAAYLRVFSYCHEMGYPNLYRIWNYIPRINEPDAHGLERYRAFCRGRAIAFFDFGHYLENSLPAGTGVGTRSGPLTIVFLASRNQPVNLENPKQVPAYHYPALYGPKPPSFARATFLPGPRGVELFVSGTSSILGHETVFSGDSARQCLTSLENIAVLIGSENLKRYGLSGGADLRDLRHPRVYYRHAHDVETFRDICRNHFSPKEPAIFLQADICRDDLSVEIEGMVHLESGIQ